MRKNIITGIILIGAIILIAFKLISNKKGNEAKIAVVAEKNAAVSVKIDTVKTEDISLDFSTNGNFEPMQQLTFSAEKPGKVMRILVKEGDEVYKGRTLAIVRSDVVNVSVQAAEAAYQNALNDYTRFENAFKTGGVTKQQLDQTRLMMVNAKANYTNAKINLSDTHIKAPISGIINKKFIEVGSILAGTPPTSLFEILDVSKLKLKITVNESQVVSLRNGDSVEVIATVYPDKFFSGKITFIAPMADESLNFPVEVEIENNITKDLKAGMYGTANFTSIENMMIVPRNAFIGSVKENQIFIVENGIAKLKNVISGKSIGDKVQVLKGLNNDDLVIVTGQINLLDGSKIEVIK